LLDVAAEMAKVHEIQVPQLQGAIKRKVVDTKKQDSTKHLMTSEADSDSELNETLNKTPNKMAKNLVDKVQLNQVAHEVKNNNKQTAQKINDVKKQMEALESKLSMATDHLNLMQNNYQAILTQLQKPTADNNRNVYNPLLNSYNNRQDKSYQQHQQHQHTSQYLNSYQRKPQ